jgi:hypothetical protein
VLQPRQAPKAAPINPVFSALFMVVSGKVRSDLFPTHLLPDQWQAPCQWRNPLDFSDMDRSVPAGLARYAGGRDAESA